MSQQSEEGVWRDIQEVLFRRGDLSTFVVHLCRDYEDGSQAKDNLKSIITEGVLLARTARGWARHVDQSERGDSQNVVCFTETPLDHLDLQTGNIKKRRYQFQPFGLAFTKMQARRRGINPVWYVDRTPGHGWKPYHALNALKDEAVATGFTDHPVSDMLPFIEEMYTLNENVYEWWWEREWRHLGPLSFAPGKDVAFYICPESEMTEFNKMLQQTKRDAGAPPPPCIDARWGLERILAHLMNLRPDEISPFAQS
jgi:hypothetical protein